MDNYKVGLRTLIFLVTAIATISVASADACNACNCQFNNVQMLSQLIEAEVSRVLANEPLVRFFRIVMQVNQQIQLQAADHSTLLYTDVTDLATISLSIPSQPITSSNNLLAYRPRYNGSHNSNLAAIFVNLEGVYPCLVPLTGYTPICKVFTDEEDGFRGGKAFIDSGDIGNHFQIFSSTTDILTYGIAIQDCPESCLTSYLEISIACYLPRAACSG